MKWNSLKTIAITATFVGLGLVTVTYACKWGTWHSHFPQVTTSSDLSAEQQAQVQELQQNYANRLRPLEKELALLRPQLEDYVMSNEATIEGIRQRIAEMRTVEAQIYDLRLDAERSVRQVGPTPGPFRYPNTGNPHSHAGYECDWDACSFDWIGLGRRDAHRSSQPATWHGCCG